MGAERKRATLIVEDGTWFVELLNEERTRIPIAGKAKKDVAKLRLSLEEAGCLLEVQVSRTYGGEIEVRIRERVRTASQEFSADK